MVLQWNTLNTLIQWKIYIFEMLWRFHTFVTVCKFSLVVGTFKRPDPDTITEKDLEVDIVKAWSDLDRTLVAEGLVSGWNFSR